MWYDAVSVEEKLDDVRVELTSLLDGEEDSERKEYNDYLINSLDEAIDYIRILRREIRGKENGTHDNQNLWNNAR